MGYNAGMAKRAAILADLRDRISDLPTCPGVYLFKDAAGVVLYVGKAKSLRPRVASYFQPSADLVATRGPEIARMIETLVVDVDVLECESEVDALLRESRLIKDIQPRFNERQKDDKSFPYLQITTDEDFPRVGITRQPKSKGAKLFGPFVSPMELRAALPLMQRVFKFRTCKLDIENSDEGRRYFRPCILFNIKQCTAPCAEKVAKADYADQIADLVAFLNSKASQVRRKLTKQMEDASAKLDFERAAALRDELKALEGLQRRGLTGEHVQPEVFYVDPTEGLARLSEVLSLQTPPRTIEGIDIATLAGGESVGAVVFFLDGVPFKDKYRRFRIKTVEGVDDFACVREVVARHYRQAGAGNALFPDVVLVDGGAGQLNAALDAFAGMDHRPPMVVSLAKREEEIYRPGRSEPIRLSRNNAALQLLQQVRDEAHRFAQHYHHILRRKAVFDQEVQQGRRPPRKKKAK